MQRGGWELYVLQLQAFTTAAAALATAALATPSVAATTGAATAIIPTATASTSSAQPATSSSSSVSVAATAAQATAAAAAQATICVSQDGQWCCFLRPIGWQVLLLAACPLYRVLQPMPGLGRCRVPLPSFSSGMSRLRQILE
jgi:hypothetical protein